MKVMLLQHTENHPLVNKSMIMESPKPSQFPIEKMKGDLIEPLIEPTSVKEMINKSGTLADGISAFAEDIILNDIVFTDENEKLTQFYNAKNKLELSYAVEDWVTYGYGALELLHDESGKELKKFKQIPADTCRVKKVKNAEKDEQGNDTYSYYCVQSNEKKQQTTFRFSHKQYTDDDIEKYREVLWFGGGSESDWYNKPLFLSKYNDLLIDVGINVLKKDDVVSGNQLSGIFTVAGTNIDENFEEELETNITDNGKGVLSLVIRSDAIPGTDNKPPEVNFIKLDKSGADDLDNQQDKAQKAILQSFKMPPTRLGRLDDTESMASNKSDNVWNIYTKTVQKSQMIIQIFIDTFNENKFEITSPCEISTPIFYDETANKSQEIRDTAKDAFLDYETAILALAKLHPEWNIDIGAVKKDPVLKARYFNGVLLGSNNEPVDTIQNLDDKIDELRSS
ncbi:MAG: hypothetical protein LBM02_08160 [Lachnospiraceae bacterium]|jgi:hypothetical protein|nr:hypothetical protein [Lachnospiraceae bacterium]